MRLLPREHDRLLVFLAAELARRRRARGLLLNQVEAVALISDETLEAARDGLPFADVERAGYGILAPADVLPEVPALVSRIELEPLFPDGPRLVVLHDPITQSAPPSLEGADLEPTWIAEGVALSLTNHAAVPVGITSHFHLFEVNREVELDRRAAWGLRLALPAGAKLVLEPGASAEARAIPLAGLRVVRGHGPLVDGPLDEPGAFDAALDLARTMGYRGV
jgi:urease subunit gamma/beta